MQDKLSQYKKKRERSLKRRHYLLPIDRLSYWLYFLIFERQLMGTEITKFLKNERILVLSPHQDDETLGGGGFLINCRRDSIVQPVYMTSGKGPAWLRSEKEREQLLDIRCSEALNVCRQLDTLDPIFLGFEQLNLQFRQEVTDRLTEEIKKFQPSVIMTPFFTDSHKEHLWTTRCLAQIPKKLCTQTKVLMYRTHGQLPNKFVNTYFGLGKEINDEKENILLAYKSQKMNIEITREKYLMYSKLLPQNIKGKYQSIERFCTLTFDDFLAMDRGYGDDEWLYKIRSINYAPYSFRKYIENELIFRRSKFCKEASRWVTSPKELGA